MGQTVFLGASDGNMSFSLKKTESVANIAQVTRTNQYSQIYSSIRDEETAFLDGAEMMQMNKKKSHFAIKRGESKHTCIDSTSVNNLLKPIEYHRLISLEEID